MVFSDRSGAAQCFAGRCCLMGVVAAYLFVCQLLAMAIRPYLVVRNGFLATKLKL
jgi:hypothetical protein